MISQKNLSLNKFNMSLNNLKKKIIKKNVKIGIIGIGYVGLPLAISFAKKI